MKNQFTQFSIAIIAFVMLAFLMSYTRPAADEPKQYIIVYGSGATFEGQNESFQKAVNQKLSEGWHLQGGVTTNQLTRFQAMVK
jgi:hypothetical protein